DDALDGAAEAGRHAAVQDTHGDLAAPDRLDALAARRLVERRQLRVRERRDLALNDVRRGRDPSVADARLQVGEALLVEAVAREERPRLLVELYVPSSQDARYLACSSVSRSMSTPIVASFRRAISLSISTGTP